MALVQRPLVASPQPSVAEAVWEQKRLSIHYAGWGKRERMLLVEPLGSSSLKAGDWYSVSTRREADTRIYKIADPSRSDALGGAAERPKAFNLAAEWSRAVARFETDLLTERARLRVRGLARLVFFFRRWTKPRSNRRRSRGDAGALTNRAPRICSAAASAPWGLMLRCWSPFSTPRAVA